MNKAIKMYKCDTCNYSTKDCSNYIKHEKTKKHKLKIYKFPHISTQCPPEKESHTPMSFFREKVTQPLTDFSDQKVLQSSHNSSDDDDSLLEKEHEPRHKVSKFQRVYVCPFCNNEFSRRDSLKRHVNTCKSKKQEEEISKSKYNKVRSNARTKEKKFKDSFLQLQRELMEKEKTISTQGVTISKYEEQIHYFMEVLKISEENNGKSVSAFRYISENFNKADPLRAITFEEFAKNNIIKYITNNNEKTIDENIVEDMIYCHRHKILHEYIGDVIVEIYKQIDPEDQSIWSTDQSRLKYVIRHSLDEGTTRWVADTNGVNTAKMLIEPLTNQIMKIINDYRVNYCVASDNGEEYDYDTQNRMMRDYVAIGEMEDEINDGKLQKKLLKYIATHLSTKDMNKETETIEDVHNKE